MADIEVSKGANAEAIALAKAIIGTQTDEIAKMKAFPKQ